MHLNEPPSTFVWTFTNPSTIFKMKFITNVYSYISVSALVSPHAPSVGRCYSKSTTSERMLPTSKLLSYCMAWARLGNIPIISQKTVQEELFIVYFISHCHSCCGIRIVWKMIPSSWSRSAIPDEEIEYKLHLQSSWVLRLELDRAEMIDRKLTMHYVTGWIAKSFKTDLFVSGIWSEDGSEKLIICCQVLGKSWKGRRSFDGGRYFLRSFENTMLNSVSLRGVKGIKRAFLTLYLWKEVSSVDRKRKVGFGNGRY